MSTGSILIATCIWIFCLTRFSNTSTKIRVCSTKIEVMLNRHSSKIKL